MTETTIKEKIEGILDEDNGTDYDINGIILKVARLICEELLGEPIPNEEEIDPIFKKAQVILKALE